jgi:hypothetical protein
MQLALAQQSTAALKHVQTVLGAAAPFCAMSCRSPAVCAAAAAGGHTHVLAWLREQVSTA